MKYLFTLPFLFSSLFSSVSLEEITGTHPTDWVQNGERWNFEERFMDKKEELTRALEKLGIFEERRAEKTHYNYAIVPGSLYASIKARINFLIKEWKRGVRFDTLVFLTGKRKIHPEKESPEILGCTLKTEIDVMRLVWEQSELSEELRKIPLEIIDADPFPFRERPNTLATVLAWLAKNPMPGSCLVVSNQPYVAYQHEIFVALLPKTFSVESIGAAGGRNTPLSVLMDTVGRTELYRKGFKLF